MSPDVGDTVSETGESLSDIVRDLPDVKVGGDGVKLGELAGSRAARDKSQRLALHLAVVLERAVVAAG